MWVCGYIWIYASTCKNSARGEFQSSFPSRPPYYRWTTARVVATYIYGRYVCGTGNSISKKQGTLPSQAKIPFSKNPECDEILKTGIILFNAYTYSHSYLQNEALHYKDTSAG